MFFLLRLLGFFSVRSKFSSRFCNIFPGFLPQNPLFFQVFQVFQVWTCFSRFSRCGGNPEFALIDLSRGPLHNTLLSKSPTRMWHSHFSSESNIKENRLRSFVVSRFWNSKQQRKRRGESYPLFRDISCAFGSSASSCLWVCLFVCLCCEQENTQKEILEENALTTTHDHDGRTEPFLPKQTSTGRERTTDSTAGASASHEPCFSQPPNFNPRIILKHVFCTMITFVQRTLRLGRRAFLDAPAPPLCTTLQR